ncbi:class A beta-lactamase-related serine hydrolase [Bacteroidota bacterium]|nr:class A beta-lactamase-related serine hydrolase [Bacteroidota bacterium]
MKKLIFILLIINLGCSSSSDLQFINRFVDGNTKLLNIINNNDIQLKLTVIDSAENFIEHEYNIDTNKYFYPASTVKLPIALFALEKLNENKILSIDTPFMLEDDTLITTFKNELEKIFILSNNQANNRFFEFTGQDYLNKKFISKGFYNSTIFHRLSTINSSKIEGKRVDFFTNDSIISFQNNNKEPKKLKLEKIKKGKGYINSTGEMIKQEMDFSEKNYISITDLHRIMKILFFPEKFNEKERFNLTSDQREILFKYMSGFPKDFGYSPEKFPYYFTKFFIYGDKELEVDENIVIYNKVGLAYGQLSDVAYIKKNNVSIILTATIDVNTNKIYNDDIYDYDSIGFPFLAEISREIVNRLSD